MIKLELTLDETNALLANLGTLPYQNVFSLIEKIRLQGLPQAEELAKQTQESQAAAEATPVEEVPQQ
jgi:hypothetical protein